jgi:hypothetical protein
MTQSSRLAAGPRMTSSVMGLLLASCAFFFLLSGEGLSGLFLLHAGLMLTAWCLCIPFGVLIARYFKVTRQQDFPAELDNYFWWNWHRWLQYLGVAFSTAGYGVMVAMNGFGIQTLHSKIGIVIVILGWCQVISAWARGSKGGPTDTQMHGDHFNMTPRRRAFEIIHKSAGWIAVLGAVAAAATGIELGGLSVYWHAGLMALTLGYLVTARYFHAQKRYVPTYMAIWGKSGPEKSATLSDISHTSVSAPKLRN